MQIAEWLRRGGLAADLILCGEEPHPPYQRPPLSKKWLIDAGAVGALTLRGPAALERLKITMKLGTRVRAIDRSRREVELADGARVPYRKLALGTRSPPPPPPAPRPP